MIGLATTFKALHSDNREPNHNKSQVVWLNYNHEKILIDKLRKFSKFNVPSRDQLDLWPYNKE